MSDENFPRYRYEPLDPTRRQIRLIRLLTEQAIAWQTTIDCEIFHADLDENPEYEALSYVWGSETRPYNIRVNGHSLGVTLNLFSALSHLRTAEPRVLWVDAICINQESHSERGQQVAIMRDIFAGASRTTIWLGEFDFLPVQGSKDFLGHLQRTYDDSFLRNLVSDQKSDKNNPEVRNMQRIQNSTWFSRIWVVQETACGREHLLFVLEHRKSLGISLSGGLQGLTRKVLL